MWENALGGLTFELHRPHERLFVKWSPAKTGPDLAAEAARMSWAAQFTAVPRVQDQGADAEGAWIVHDLDAMRRLADRVVLLRRGKVETEGPPDVVLTAETPRATHALVPEEVASA